MSTHESEQQSLPWTGERYLPEVKGGIELEHLHRYLFARQFVAGKRILDIASGEGYGSNLLSQYAGSVIGVDISMEAVVYATNKYKASNLEYRQGSAAAIPLADHSVEVIISFETIEHHTEHEAMMSEFKRVLVPGGLVVISSPDKLEYSIKPNYDNPYHVKELYRDQFEFLLNSYFKNHAISGQRIVYGSAILGESECNSISTIDFHDDSLTPQNGLQRAIYLIAIVSDAELPKVDYGMLEKYVLESDEVQNLSGQIGELHQQVNACNVQTNACSVQIDELNKVIIELNSEFDDHRLNFEKLLAEKEEVINSLNCSMGELSLKMDFVLASHSWQITKPLRFARRSIKLISFRNFRKMASDLVRGFWSLIPLPNSSKQKIKNLVFKIFPFFFRKTVAFKQWQNPDYLRSQENSGHLNYAVPIVNEEVKFVPLLHASAFQNPVAKLICFYLPQFHAISQNNEWWGDGFTEWTNVNPAVPQFEGHYQPHVSGELGDYNLLNVSTMQRQVELAKLYGIEGFCFYFYWFAGTRLLETPIENYLNERSLDLPFCLCWANENWSRRWDGMDHEILISQNHSAEDDFAFIKHISKYLLDPRYIKVNGKPLLLIYRPNLLPEPLETVKRFRGWCAENGIGEIYLAYTQSFEATDPSNYGFDAAIEFPPCNLPQLNITQYVKPLTENFACNVFDYRAIADRSKKYSQPGYKLFRGVAPSWDNTARRKNKGTIFLNSSPRLYQHWLEDAINNTIEHESNHDERLVFINAWNEWAEGAHLEPDAKYGYAYLEATRKALTNTSLQKNGSVLVVTHDCHPHGAQILILESARQLRKCGFQVYVIALGEGRLLSEFEQVAETLLYKDDQSASDFIARIKAAGTGHAIVNSVVSGRIVPLLKKSGFKIVSLIHELPGVIHSMKQEGNARLIANLSDKVIFPARLVYEKFIEIVPVDEQKVVIRNQGVVRQNPYKHRKSEAINTVRALHNLPQDARIVLNIAYLDYRKGPDLFVDMAAEVLKSEPNAVFIWVGHVEQEMESQVIARITQLGLNNKIILAGFVRDPLAYYAAANVFALTSREDPFPNVVLESIEAGVPVVAFEGASGAGDFICANHGLLAAAFEPADFARKIIELLQNPPQEMTTDLSLNRYVLDLMHHLTGFRRVSVVVPNYNYSNHIEQRLESIYGQSYPIYEVLVLDDFSSDDSVEVIKNYLSENNHEARLLLNSANSGSVFKQWDKGSQACSGDLIWIAEADDLSEPEFLQNIVPKFEDEEMVLGYCQSKQIDASGNVIAENYLDYTRAVSDCCLTEYSRAGHIEISKAMCIKNTIPNVSAVIFSAGILKSILSDLDTALARYRVAGDWLVYLHVLMKGKVYFNDQSLNMHRRHATSVTSALNLTNHLDEVIEIQKAAIQLIDAPVDVIAKAEEYVNLLCKQFNLPQRKDVHSEKREIV